VPKDYKAEEEYPADYKFVKGRISLLNVFLD